MALSAAAPLFVAGANSVWCWYQQYTTQPAAQQCTATPVRHLHHGVLFPAAWVLLCSCMSCHVLMYFEPWSHRSRWCATQTADAVFHRAQQCSQPNSYTGKKPVPWCLVPSSLGLSVPLHLLLCPSVVVWCGVFGTSGQSYCLITAAGITDISMNLSWSESQSCLSLPP